MNLPILSKPVNRKQTRMQKITKGIQPSCGNKCKSCLRNCLKLPATIRFTCLNYCYRID